MYCVKCGREYKEGDLYCGNCGNKLDKIIVSKHQIADKHEEIIKGNLNLRIVLVLIVVLIGIGITVFLVTESKITHRNTSNNISQSANITKSSDSADSAAKDLVPDEKKKEDEAAAKEKTAKEAKEAFGRLLQDKAWLSKNANYTKAGSVQFLILDINQDGIPEMLLSNKSGSLASYTLSVVTYDNGNTNVQVLNTSHGGFMGYLSDEKVFLINGETMGYSWGTGYKLEDNQCKEVYKWEDNSGTTKELVGKLNGSQVSEEEYKEFCKKFENMNPKSDDFSEINYENIKKYLDVEPIK